MFFLTIFPRNNTFTKLEFQASQWWWRLVGRRTGIAWGDRRPPPPSPEGAAQAGWKRHLWAIMNNLFSELCGTWSPSNTQKVICSPLLLNSSNDSLVSHKERWAKHWEKINKIFVYRFLGTLFLKAKWSSNTSWERGNFVPSLQYVLHNTGNNFLR